MLALEPITPQNAMIFKAVRLRALQDTPSAFGSTYAKESQFTDADWIKRAVQWNGDRSAAFLAMDVHTACGIVGSFLDQDDATRAHLGSMWTAPMHRHRSIGRLFGLKASVEHPEHGRIREGSQTHVANAAIKT